MKNLNLKYWMLNKTIWLIAIVGFMILTFLNKRAVRKVCGSTKGYDFQSAMNIDIFCNTEFRTWLNRNLLTTASIHHFGHREETISSVLGKNQRDETLSKYGQKWRKRVDNIDKSIPNHCLHWINKSINHQEHNFLKYFK